jgi:hypothetical protein
MYSRLAAMLKQAVIIICILGAFGCADDSKDNQLSGGCSEEELPTYGGGSTTTPEPEPEPSLYSYFSGSTVDIVVRLSDGSIKAGETGTWCPAGGYSGENLETCSCGISSFVGSTQEFTATINGDYPPFTVQWTFDNRTYNGNNFTITSVEAASSSTVEYPRHLVTMSVTDAQGHQVFARCNRPSQVEMMYYGR